jgi:prophage maintenance system killer protein
MSAAKLDLADSALHAPLASFGGEEFYPDFCDKAAVLLVRLAKNHPVLDGTKRGRLGDTANVHRSECMVMGGLSVG